MLLQLQQMIAARQSRQMPVKHQQQPPVTVILQPVNAAPGVAQFKGNGRPSFSVMTHDHASVRITKILHTSM
jgi:hypothetical protein